MNNDELMDEMVQRLGVELKGLLAHARDGRVSAACVEHIVREELWHFGAQVSGVLLEELDRSLVGQRPVHDRRTRTVVTLFGPVDVTRSRCQDGSYPLDEAVGLRGQQGWTASVQEAVALLSCDSPFETVSDVVKRVMGLSISRTRSQQLAEQAGQRAAGGLEELPPPEATATGKTLVLATDGCQAPQRDGWHEVKVGTIYTNESRVQTAGGRPRILSQQYLASLEGVEAWGTRMRQAADQWHMGQARRVVVMGDGAPWIWNLSAEHFPQAIEIVDFYHAVEHLWSTGESLWGDRRTSTATRTWVRRARRLLKRGGVDLVIAAIQRGRDRPGSNLSEAAATTVRRNLEYFKTNRHRMQYQRYRRLNLPIGTGAVEGSCKFVVQSRFKRPGSRWSRKGLANMLSLKMARLNGHWDTLWPCLRAG
jgi:hypothetical protein